MNDSHGLPICPECGGEIDPRGIGYWKASPKARRLYLVAALTTALWVGLMLVVKPPFLIPSGLRSVVLLIPFYLGPGLVLGLYANSLPKIRHLRCGHCTGSSIERAPY